MKEENENAKSFNTQKESLLSLNRQDYLLLKNVQLDIAVLI